MAEQWDQIAKGSFGEPASSESNTSVEKTFHRAASVYEIWVAQEGKMPQVYIVLLHKKSKNWWEIPGGEIKGERTPARITSTAVNEIEEEALTNLEPKHRQAIHLTGDPIVTIAGRYAHNETQKQLGVRSYPMVIRDYYEQLPEIILGKDSDLPERQEHDDYYFMDMTEIYYAWNYGERMNYMKSVMESAFHNSFYKKIPSQFIIDSKNEKIVHLESPEEHYQPRIASLQLSTVTSANLFMYTYSLNRLADKKPFTKSGQPTEISNINLLTI